MARQGVVRLSCSQQALILQLSRPAFRPRCSNQSKCPPLPTFGHSAIESSGIVVLEHTSEYHRRYTGVPPGSHRSPPVWGRSRQGENGPVERRMNQASAALTGAAEFAEQLGNTLLKPCLVQWSYIILSGSSAPALWLAGAGCACAERHCLRPGSVYISLR